MTRFHVTSILNKLCGYTECPIVNGKKFDFIPGCCDYFTAMEIASLMGGWLAMPRTREELEILREACIKRYYNIIDCDWNTGFWLGMTDYGHEGIWVFDRPPKEGEEYDAVHGPYEEISYDISDIVIFNNNGNVQHWCSMTPDGYLNDLHYGDTVSGFAIEYKVR